VLSFIDVINTWFIKSYYKTEEKLEWLVVPLIVILTFVVGLLQAVLLGLSMSAILFIASFCKCMLSPWCVAAYRSVNANLPSCFKVRSGVVKYAASGVNVRSTIERPPKVSRWLDQSADQIQILVMQNFLFFGNASSLNSYVVRMFQDPDSAIDPLFVTPCPKVIIVDLTLVTGMDTSAVDAFSDILAVCANNNCKLFLSGVSPRLHRVMSLCGIKPDSTRDRSERKLRFFSGLDAALGKAEDLLIELEHFEDNDSDPSPFGDGFVRALHQIDQQHGTEFAKDLCQLQDQMTAVVVEPGDCLYEDHHLDGLFFIEHGVLVRGSYTMYLVGLCTKSYACRVLEN
jgi:MFS superfamily sulfate permease-like transporter